jgi:uncharacterized membrane protein YbaN (DUF454 family)
MRLWFVLLGHACLAIGAVGAFVPLLPTTPFVLLAAYFYSRGSQRLHRWLTAHPRFGRPILDWQEFGVIRPRAKWISTFLIVASLTYPIVFKDLSLVVKVVAAFVGVCVLTFIHTRPSRPRVPGSTPRHQPTYVERERSVRATR